MSVTFNQQLPTVQDRNGQPEAREERPIDADHLVDQLGSVPLSGPPVECRAQPEDGSRALVINEFRCVPETGKMYARCLYGPWFEVALSTVTFDIVGQVPKAKWVPSMRPGRPSPGVFRPAVDGRGVELRVNRW